uniref:Zinc finger GRF-type domain-containing protein n=1 Tax=Brassica oleracea var. oleracea TaxID=109376 RepID=A0A0D3DLX9_BRAOL
MVIMFRDGHGDDAEKSCRGNSTFSSQIDLTVFRFSLDGDACGDKVHRRFHPESLRIPHESIPSLSPTSFSADFNLKENTSALLSPNRLSLLFANKKTFPFSIISSVLLLMDPRNPYSQNSGYRRHWSLRNASFSSQQSEAPSQPQDTPVERMVRRKWTPGDDEVLISVWLNTSKDAVVGNEHKLRTFWKCVDEYFATTLHENIENIHCKQRWHIINDQTNKFCAAFAAAERQITSGQSDNDVLKWISLNTPKTAGSKRKSGEVSSQPSSAHVGEVSSQSSMRPEGIKAAKASMNGSKGKAIEDYKSILELKMEDLARKEKLSKLAILDTLLAKKDPLSESEETVKNKLFCLVFYVLVYLDVMGLDYSYTQPSDSEDYGLGNSADSGNSSTEMNILLDQAEIEAARVQYPPQPEVEFGFPKECYCGGEPLIRTSYTRTDPRRRFYTCENIDDGDFHVHKWWDVAATEEIKAIGTQYALLEKTVSELSKKKSPFRNGFELVLGGLVLLVM